MFKIDIKFNKRDFETKLQNAAQEAIEDRVRKIRCPQHGRHARITRKGDKYDLTGCCEKLIEEVKATLK